MPLTVQLFPCLEDNYGFLARDEASGRVACIDTPDAVAILEALDRSGWGRLDLILNTHWHLDHTGGNAAVQAATGCVIFGPEEVRRVTPVDHVVTGDGTVDLGETRFEVTETPGHTLGHVVYRSVPDGIAFVGDTLFPMGCGRLFEGSPEQMFDSLAKLAAWPDDTILHGAHEYAAANARFALSLSNDPLLAAHAADIFAAREGGRPTVPTNVGVEKRFNPFLTAKDAIQFAERRAAKDGFRS